jgi:hypothetical protein
MSQEWMEKLASLTPNKEHALASGRQQAERAAADQVRTPQVVHLLELIVAEQARQAAILDQILAAMHGQSPGA